MKVAMITSIPMPPREGIGSHVMGISRELVRRGHEVSILTRGKLERIRRSTLDGVEIVFAPYAPLYPLHVDVHRTFLMSALRELPSRPDIIHYHSPLVPYLAPDIPSVSTVHTPMAFDVPQIEVVDAKSLAARIMLYTTSIRTERKLIEKSARIMTVSHRVAEELLQLGVSCQKIVFVGNGVDQRIFNSSCHSRDECSILSVGRLDYRKGLQDLIEAVRIVTREYPEIVLNIVGDGPLWKRLKSCASKLGIARNVRFHGRVSTEELIRFYSSCGVFVLSSRYEGMPGVVLEAAACCAPVVSTDVGGISQIIENERTGIVVPCKSPDMLAEAIMKMLENQDNAREMAFRLHEHVLRNFTWSVIGERLQQVYEEVLTEG